MRFKIVCFADDGRGAYDDSDICGVVRSALLKQLPGIVIDSIDVGGVPPTSEEILKSAGRECVNAKFFWHQVDGYCKECQVHVETDDQIQARRTAKGYR